MRQGCLAPHQLSLARAVAGQEALEPRHALRPIAVAPDVKRIAPSRRSIDLHGVAG